MAWVELVPFGCILLLVAWVFLRPLPKQSNEEQDEAAAEPESSQNDDVSAQNHKKVSDDMHE